MVSRLLDFYPPPDVSDPKAFIAGLVALFARYPTEVLEIAVDPAQGVPSRIKSLTSIAAVREVCEELYQPILRRIERERADASHQALLAPRGPRTPEEQARIDEQVACVLNKARSA